MKGVVGLFCAAAIIWAAEIRRPTWDEIPAPARSIAGQIGINASNFTVKLDSIDRRTASRLVEGDWDDLIYYMLQSRRFTQALPIEPARSAIEFASAARVPDAVTARMKALLAAMKAPSDERQRYLAKLVPTADAIAEHYARTMKFLQEKELRCREQQQPQACIADLYANRGLSTDTSRLAFRSVEAAAHWMEENRPAFHARRVLVLGPGLDFAPRTGLRDDTPPVVYQPGQVRQLLHPDQVDCADVNPLVIAYTKTVCDAAYLMNIASGLPDNSPRWDLIIATNVLLYLDDVELLLAMNNIRHMLNPGGIFLHNDARFQASLFGRACGLPVIQFGEISLDASRQPPLIDHYVLHELPAPNP